MKLKTIRNLLLVSGALFASTFANAGSYTFEFLANNASYQVDGIFTTSDVLNAVNGYDILGISGTVIGAGAGGGAITSLVANPSSPNPISNFGFIYDNNLFPSLSPVLSNPGVLFTTTSAVKWNLFGNSPTDYSLGFYPSNIVTGSNWHEVHGTFTTTAVPEPESYALMLAGLGLMGAIARRRKSKAA